MCPKTPCGMSQPQPVGMEHGTSIEYLGLRAQDRLQQTIFITATACQPNVISRKRLSSVYKQSRLPAVLQGVVQLRVSISQSKEAATHVPNSRRSDCGQTASWGYARRPLLDREDCNTRYRRCKEADAGFQYALKTRRPSCR